MVEAKRSRVVEDEDVAADDVERGAPKKKKSNGDTKAGGVNDDGETYWSACGTSSNLARTGG
jgi:hypothetical protein